MSDDLEQSTDDEERQPSPDDVLRRIYGRYLMRGLNEKAEDFRASYQTAEHLLAPEFDEVLTDLSQDGYAGDIVIAANELRDTARVAKEAAEAAAAQASDEVAKEKIRRERAAKAEQERQAAQEAERLARLEAEVDEEEAAKSGSTTFDDQQLTIFNEAVEAVRSDAPLEERVQAAERAIEAGQRMETRTIENPVHIDPESFLQRVNEKLQQRKEEKK